MTNLSPNHFHVHTNIISTSTLTRMHRKINKLSSNTAIVEMEKYLLSTLYGTLLFYTGVQAEYKICFLAQTVAKPNAYKFSSS